MDNTREFWLKELEQAKQSGNQQQVDNYNYLLSTYTDSYFDNLTQFFDKLPNDGDLMLLVLKGHLLVEQQIRSYVNNHFPNQKALKGVFKETSTVISLGRAYCDDNCEETMQLWDCFAKLNNIRNHMAHNIDHTGLEHKIEDFLVKSEKFVSFLPNSDSVFDRMHSAINAIYQKALYLATVQEKQYQHFVESRT
ncbi:hypothetical protein [Vibrio kanaloae]|uniref:hypothetical protein n=1 Tax=Vibrio kanaloae TaxID=170673 RepID=UPI00124434F0|nr:hypothetical protein [Vibrio kanaloae]KAB0463656.1 hypothetical protein F7Q89_12240 [Vibrio kanaloae]